MTRLWQYFCAFGVLAMPGLAQSPVLNARDLFFESASASPPAGPSVGVLYNILLVEPNSAISHPVDPERTFRTKECFVLELKPNTQAYLYVFSQGASRQWVALFPEEDAPIPSNLTKPWVTKRIPTNTCIEFTEPAATERLFLVLLQERADSAQLLEALRSSRGTQETKIDRVALIQKGLIPRDLRLKRVDRPKVPAEKPFTTYAVARPPGLFIEIPLRHE